MNSHEASEMAETLIPDRWKSFTHTSPLLLRCIHPLATTAPDLLDTQAIINALLAVYCVHPERFLLTKWVLPKQYTHDEMKKALIKTFNIWKNNRQRALRYKTVQRIDDERAGTIHVYVWPTLELGLKSLVPTLPGEFDPRKDMGPAMMRDQNVEAFLRSITFLLSVVTKKL